ncbi:MAG: type II toxin-antitoxin system VapC family toxin [Armatimonadota bacterium]
MSLVDSCGWIEYFLDGPLAGAFERHLAQPDVLVPTIVLFEVYKVIKRDVSEDMAERAAVQIRTMHLAPLTDDIALLAADICLKHRLAMADAIVYATARAYEATLVTSDYHFAQMPEVEYLAGE